jgi:hypothetical protein
VDDRFPSGRDASRVEAVVDAVDRMAEPAHVGVPIYHAIFRRERREERLVGDDLVELPTVIASSAARSSR